MPIKITGFPTVPTVVSDPGDAATSKTKTDAPPQKTASTEAVKSTDATEAKATLHTNAQLMKSKLHKDLKSHQDVGEAPASKTPPPLHPHPVDPLHPAPVSVPHPAINLNITSASAPSTLVNDKPAAQLKEEKDKVK